MAYGKKIKDAIRPLWDEVLSMEFNEEIHIPVKTARQAQILINDLNSARKYSEDAGLVDGQILVDKRVIPGAKGYIITVRKEPPLLFNKITKTKDRVIITTFQGNSKITKEEIK